MASKYGPWYWLQNVYVFHNQQFEQTSYINITEVLISHKNIHKLQLNK